MILLALFAFAYLVGSIPFAVIFGKMKGVDILKEGSGNPGMTNVKRLLGPKYGYACFILDVLKGLVPTLVARLFIMEGAKWHGLDAQLLWFSVGFVAIAGHCASIFLRFKGGKGVSTALGAIIGACPAAAACCFGIFLIVLVATRYMVMASVVGVSVAIPLNFVIPHETLQLLPVFILISAVVLWRHRPNFARLRAGTEPKFSFGRTDLDA